MRSHRPNLLERQEWITAKRENVPERGRLLRRV